MRLGLATCKLIWCPSDAVKLVMCVCSPSVTVNSSGKGPAGQGLGLDGAGLCKGLRWAEEGSESVDPLDS